MNLRINLPLSFIFDPENPSSSFPRVLTSANSLSIKDKNTGAKFRGSLSQRPSKGKRQNIEGGIWAQKKASKPSKKDYLGVLSSKSESPSEKSGSSENEKRDAVGLKRMSSISYGKNDRARSVVDNPEVPTKDIYPISGKKLQRKQFEEERPGARLLMSLAQPKALKNKKKPSVLAKNLLRSSFVDKKCARPILIDRGSSESPQSGSREVINIEDFQFEDSTKEMGTSPMRFEGSMAESPNKMILESVGNVKQIIERKTAMMDASTNTDLKPAAKDPALKKTVRIRLREGGPVTVPGEESVEQENSFEEAVLKKMRPIEKKMLKDQKGREVPDTVHNLEEDHDSVAIENESLGPLFSILKNMEAEKDMGQTKKSKSGGIYKYLRTISKEQRQNSENPDALKNAMADEPIIREENLEQLPLPQNEENKDESFEVRNIETIENVPPALNPLAPENEPCSISVDERQSQAVNEAPCPSPAGAFIPEAGSIIFNQNAGAQKNPSPVKVIVTETIQRETITSIQLNVAPDPNINVQEERGNQGPNKSHLEGLTTSDVFGEMGQEAEKMPTYDIFGNIFQQKDNNNSEEVPSWRPDAPGQSDQATTQDVSISSPPEAENDKKDQNEDKKLSSNNSQEKMMVERSKKSKKSGSGSIASDEHSFLEEQQRKLNKISEILSERRMKAANERSYSSSKRTEDLFESFEPWPENLEEEIRRIENRIITQIQQNTAMIIEEEGSKGPEREKEAGQNEPEELSEHSGFLSSQQLRQIAEMESAPIEEIPSIILSKFTAQNKLANQWKSESKKREISMSERIESVGPIPISEALINLPENQKNKEAEHKPLAFSFFSQKNKELEVLTEKNTENMASTKSITRKSIFIDIAEDLQPEATQEALQTEPDPKSRETTKHHIVQERHSRDTSMHQNETGHHSKDTSMHQCGPDSHSRDNLMHQNEQDRTSRDVSIHQNEPPMLLSQSNKDSGSSKSHSDNIRRSGSTPFDAKSNEVPSEVEESRDLTYIDNPGTQSKKRFEIERVGEFLFRDSPESREMSIEEKAQVLVSSNAKSMFWKEDLKEAQSLMMLEILDMYTHAFCAPQEKILEILEECNGVMSVCRKRLVFELFRDYKTVP